jgi:hypothetical protein
MTDSMAIRKLIADRNVKIRADAEHWIGKRVEIRGELGTVNAISREGIHFRIEWDEPQRHRLRWFYEHELHWTGEIVNMAVDLKYGKVITEHGHFGEDEPVVVFRARDRLLPAVLNEYEDLCRESGSPQHHLDLIVESRSNVEDWQEHNDTKVPDSNAHMKRLEPPS